MPGRDSRAGLLTVDHRASPGLPPELVEQFGLPKEFGDGLFEAKTMPCSHCQRIVILNQERVRDRHFCPKCDAYICDDCSLTMKVSGEHKSFAQVADEYLESASRRLTTKEE